jgi:4'-phosphopantetheinyl transferase
MVDVARRQLIVGHALLGRRLAHELAQGGLPADADPATAVQLGRGPHGKPYLHHPQLVPPLEFNLAHSRGLVLLALGRGCAVGVDVEALGPLTDVDDLAAAYLAPGERAALQAVVGPARVARFYRFWTRKEAWLKLVGTGIGTGIGTDLTEIDLRRPPPGVTLVDLPTLPGYVAALAVAGEPVAVHPLRVAHPRDLFAPLR